MRISQKEEELKEHMAQTSSQSRSLKESEERHYQLERLLQDMEFKSHSTEVKAEESVKLIQKEK